MGIGRISLFLAVLAAIAGCQREAGALLDELAPAGGADAAGAFISPEGAEIGHAVLTEAPSGVLLRVDLRGLTQGWHAIHIHQIADCADGAAGFKASGGHIDPDDNAHGLLNPDGPERADMPNIYAGADGRATAEIFRGGVALYPSEAGAAENGPFPLLDDDGFAIIVHESPDNHMDQPIGGAGGRVACAAIGVTTGGENERL
ncbi:MAG: superoxide dismutase family protein [Parvularculaceae bacterium]